MHRVLTKTYVIVGITADQTDTGHVILSMVEESLFKPRRHVDGDEEYFGNWIPNFSLPEYCTRVKLDFSDYGRSNVKVGDKVSMDLTRLRDGTSFRKTSLARS